MENEGFKDDFFWKRFFIFSIPLFLIIIFLIFLKFWDPLWSPFRLKPEKVVKMAIERMEKITTLEQKMEILIDLENKARIKNKILIEARQDTRNSSKIKTEANFQNFTEEGPLSLNQENSFKIKVIDDIFYLKFEDFSKDDPLIYLNETEFKDKWLTISKNSINDFIARNKEKPELTQLAKYLEDRLNFDSLISNQDFYQTLKSFLENEYFFIKKQFPDEKIEGIKVYHYVIGFKKEILSKSLFDFFENLFLKSEISKSLAEKLSEEDRNNLKKFLSEIQENLDEVEEHLWIGKKDFYIYRIQSKLAFSIPISQEEKIKSKIEATILNSKFNQPIEIQPPTSTIDFFDAIIFSQKKMEADLAIKILLTRLKTLFVSFYEKVKSYESLCHGFKLNKNLPVLGPVFSEFENEMKKYQPKGRAGFICFTSKDSFCFQAELNLDRNYCLDSSSFSGEIKENKRCWGDGTVKNPYRCPQ